MEHPFEELLGVLFDRDIHLHLERMRAPVGILRVGVVLRGTFREPSCLTLPIDLLQDRHEADSLTLELSLEPFQSGRCKLSCHNPLRWERAP